MPYPLLLLFGFHRWQFSRSHLWHCGEKSLGRVCGWGRELTLSQQAQFKTIMVVKTLCWLVNRLSSEQCRVTTVPWLPQPPPWTQPSCQDQQLKRWSQQWPGDSRTLLLQSGWPVSGSVLAYVILAVKYFKYPSPGGVSQKTYTGKSADFWVSYDSQKPHFYVWWWQTEFSRITFLIENVPYVSCFSIHV